MGKDHGEDERGAKVPRRRTLVDAIYKAESSLEARGRAARSGKVLHVDFILHAGLCLAEAVPSLAGAIDIDARPGVLARLD